MDTKPLERFATWARRELISVVDAQASKVLANGSVPRTEHPDAVRRLESEIENHGRQHIIDKVAYTWFNRIIALRFMDVRGYTDAGVVSPAHGQEHGQPEILADAKRGNLDPDVITSARTAETIFDLFDGTRDSTNEDAEAYALLLTKYCRYWHKFMPFIFEQEGNYAELLVPANLLAEDAILSRTREVLTEEVCEDVEVIGWLYQFYISERKNEVDAAFKQNKKAGADEIPAATQLFTPHWIVRYLIENSVGRLWMLNYPDSRLIDQMTYYVAPVDERANFVKITDPKDLTVFDPACGSGHILTYAFDLLYSIYEEVGYAPSEIPGLILTHNLHGAEIDPRASALAAFALSMKARSKQRTFFNNNIEPKICVIEPISFRLDEIAVLTSAQGDGVTGEKFFDQFKHADTFGSLIQPNALQTMNAKVSLDKINVEGDILYAGTIDRARKFVRQAEMLINRYAVVVANPPYMDARNMSALLSEFLEDQYPGVATGLDVAFMKRATHLASCGGLIGFLTMDSWMSSFETKELRESLLDQRRLQTVLHLGPGAFEQISGQVVSVVATILGGDGVCSQEICFLAAANLKRGEKTKVFDNNDLVHTRTPSWFDVFPNRSLAPYSAADRVHELYSSGIPLAKFAEARTGLQSGDNARFMRYWFEVGRSSIRNIANQDSKRWVPYVKSTEAKRWFAREDMVIDWHNEGASIKNHPSATVRNASFHFLEGISFAGRGKDLRARYVLPGAICDQQNSMVFVSGMSIQFALGLLNSFAAELLVRASSPSKFNIGAMKQIPIYAELVSDEELEDLISEAIKIETQLWDSHELSSEYTGPHWMTSCRDNGLLSEAIQQDHEQKATLVNRIREIEKRNDAYFAQYFGLSQKRSVIGEDLSDSSFEAVSDFVSYAVGCMFGRYSLDESGLILADQGATLQNYLVKVPEPTLIPDAENVIPFVDDGWFEDDIVERFREFLRVTFGAEHFEENLHFVEESLGVKTLRDYFITKSGRSKFYDDHVKRYKKRPIYWMFSSPKGSFNALIYMHRYNPSTVSTVLNEYLREYQAKLEVALRDAEEAATRGSSKDQKKADRLRGILVELEEYEHEVLYPLASRQLPIDLDDGVLVNYLRFGRALKNFGLENNRKKVEGWEWPANKVEPLT